MADTQASPDRDSEGSDLPDSSSGMLVIVNGRELSVEKGVLSHADVCRLASLEVNVGISITFKRGPVERPEGILGPLDKVLATPGMVIHAMRTGDA